MFFVYVDVAAPRLLGERHLLLELLVDLAATYTRGNVEASVNLNNLTDEVYLSTCGSFGCYYGEGRSVAAKVTYTW